ncbi:H-type lectin domain-containing protein [Tropicimonas sp. TH_r6]|uniref:H-type lectin domain-containing protein n=1 Tax=Tropicimonas sp. TH_r6 TaxID=3082085 RepID=UPI002952E1EC|nr:H-type lectin domain-containing protein [Tropicimonas sp. TH_r6]MDV7144502.1 H-type lectin domain-containing protein [Tropicimonas sp. TH_r6]
MKKFRNYLIGIDQGDTRLFSDFRNDGPMWAGKGSREATVEIRFSERFMTPPSVHVSLSMVDIAASSNPRIDITARSITEEGFEIAVHTWSDTQIARASASWLAIGELAHEDDWDIS